MEQAAYRVETDLIGSLQVPAAAYYGIHTLRAARNFPITGTPISAHPDLIWGLAAVKRAAAITNMRLGLLDDRIADAIVAACDDVSNGELTDEFIVDVIQGGAGTSTNMNMNEVLANRALEHLGARRGSYDLVHPLDHVNLGQSTNDAYPTAARIGLIRASERLLHALGSLADAFYHIARSHQSTVKIGRTQLQDAVPMSVGQEFSAYAATVRREAGHVRKAQECLAEINLGGTAIGTGLSAHPEYPALACETLREFAGIDLTLASDLIEATQDASALLCLSSGLRSAAIKLSKICNDLRLLSSGPRAGLGEIQLPAVQAGSSMMPGKVNPVIPEVVNQVAFEIIGNDVTIGFAAEAGQLQLNAFAPVMVHKLFASMAHFTRAATELACNCVTGIVVNRANLDNYVRNSTAVATALIPYIGYVASSEVAKEAVASGRPVLDIAVERGLIRADIVAHVLDPGRLVNTME